MPKKLDTAHSFAPRAIDLVGIAEALHILGDISSATFYRGIASGRFPAPVKVGPNTSRWNRAKLEACVQQFEEGAPTCRSGVGGFSSADEQPSSQPK